MNYANAVGAISHCTTVRRELVRLNHSTRRGSRDCRILRMHKNSYLTSVGNTLVETFELEID